MALSIGGQLSVNDAMYQALLPAPSGAVNLASAIRSQFYSDQAYLIVHRPTSDLRAATYQETLSQMLSMVRSSWPLLSRPGHDAVFAARELTSEDDAYVRGYAKLWATPSTHEINVLSVADPAAEQVISRYLTWNNDNFANGVTSWQLTIGGQTHTMSFNITGGMNNEAVLTAARDQFNALPGTPVTAVVRTSGSSRYLEVTSDTIGSAGAFTLTNVSGSFLTSSQLLTSQTASPPGTGGISVQAADAATYQIDNGDTQISATSRQITLDDGSTVLWLLQVTPTPITVAVTPSTTDALTAVEDFVSAWNQGMGFLLANPGELTTPLAAQLNQTAGTVQSALSQIGIQRGSDGLFAIDEDRLEDAISNNLDTVRSLVAGPQGLAITAGRVAETFLSSSSRYVTHPTNYVESAALRWMAYYETRGMLVNTMG